MLDLIDFIGNLLDLLSNWRFYISLVVALGIIYLLFSMIPVTELAAVLSIPVIIAGALIGNWLQKPEETKEESKDAVQRK